MQATGASTREQKKAEFAASGHRSRDKHERTLSKDFPRRVLLKLENLQLITNAVKQVTLLHTIASPGQLFCIPATQPRVPVHSTIGISYLLMFCNAPLFHLFFALFRLRCDVCFLCNCNLAGCSCSVFVASMRSHKNVIFGLVCYFAFVPPTSIQSLASRLAVPCKL